jgi:hypothetical protein
MQKEKLTKEEFKIRLLEQQIFDELKDGYFGGVAYIRSKYEGTGIDYSKLYRRIVNYRIATYGTSNIDIPELVGIKSRAERLRESQCARTRRNRIRRG